MKLLHWDKHEPDFSDDKRSADIQFVPLAYFSNVIEAGQVCELLVNNGIRAMLKGAGFGGLEPLPLTGGYSEIRLLVAQPDFMRARQLYQAFFVNPVAADDSSFAEQDADDE